MLCLWIFELMDADCMLRKLISEMHSSFFNEHKLIFMVSCERAIQAHFYCGSISEGKFKLFQVCMIGASTLTEKKHEDHTWLIVSNLLRVRHPISCQGISRHDCPGVPGEERLQSQPLSLQTTGASNKSQLRSQSLRFANPALSSLPLSLENECASWLGVLLDVEFVPLVSYGLLKVRR